MRRRENIVIAIMAVCLFAVGASNLTDRPIQNDSIEYLGVGLHLAATGEYSFDGSAPGYHTREPGMPFLIAMGSMILGAPPVPQSCLSNEGASTQACREAYLPLKLIQIICLLVGVVVLTHLLREFNTPLVIQVVIATLVFLDGSLLFEANRFTSEILAATLLALTCLLSIRALRRRRVAYALATGVALACLVLTKVIFAYFWIFLAAAWVFILIRSGYSARSTTNMVIAFVAVHFLLVGGYMTRNYVQAGEFQILENRSHSVLAIRAAYNQMSTREFWHGFGYYTPAIGIEGFRSRNVPAEAFARLVPTYPGGFRQITLASVDSRISGLTEPERLRELESIRHESINKIFDAPLAHLRTSILLAYRGVFTSQGWGFGRHDNVESIRSRIGFGIPRFGVPLSPLLRTVLDLCLFAALFVAAVFSLTNKRFSWLLLLVLPALYAHGVYSVATHFLPRYALPEIMVRWASLTALCVIAYQTWREKVSPTREEHITKECDQTPDQSE